MKVIVAVFGGHKLLLQPVWFWQVPSWERGGWYRRDDGRRLRPMMVLKVPSE